MSKWLTKAAELNCCGASLIQAGNEQLALEYFKSALEIISLLAMGSIGNESAPEPSAGCSSDSQRTQPLASQTGAVAVSCVALEDSPRLQEKADGEVHYIFERGLTFAVNAADPISPELLSFDLAVVEFNMALSLHLLSRRWGEKPLRNALQIYNCCLGHLKRTGCQVDFCNTVLFAAMNNKAAIFYSVSNFQTARDVLASLLEGVNKCRTEGEGLTFIEDEDLEGFLFNVMLLRGARIAPAA